MITFNEYQEVSDLRDNFRREVLEEVYKALDKVKMPEILEESTSAGFGHGMDHFKSELERALVKIEQ